MSDYINNMLTSLPPYVLDLLLESVRAVQINREAQNDAEPGSHLYETHRLRAESNAARTDGIAAVAAYLAREAGWDVRSYTVLSDAFEAYKNGWRKDSIAGRLAANKES